MYLKENPLGGNKLFHVISITILSFIHWIFIKAFQSFRFESEGRQSDVRRADDLKRMISASTHTDGSAFEGAQRGIKRNRLVIRQVGRRFHRKGVRITVFPSLRE